VHAGGVGVGAAVLVLEEIGVMMEVTKVLELLDVRSEEVDEVLDDEEVSLLIVVLLGVVELLEGVWAAGVVELILLEELEDDRVEEVEDLIDDKALQFPNPAWQPVPQ
jgi:hypothetical protein